MDGITTYPFNIFGGGWEKVTPAVEQLPFKGDTIIGNDVWIGQNVTIMPGVKWEMEQLLLRTQRSLKILSPTQRGRKCRIDSFSFCYSIDESRS